MEDMIFNRYENEKNGVAGKLQKKEIISVIANM